MGNVKTAALVALLLVLPVVASATEAPAPDKGVGKLGCVRPIVHGTRWVGSVLNEVHNCRVEAALFQSGFCAHTLSDPKDWPWVGPFASKRIAILNAWGASYGHGC